MKCQVETNHRAAEAVIILGGVKIKQRTKHEK